MMYREQLMYFIDRDQDFLAMINWIEKQPVLEQPNICRELKVILEELHEKTGEDHWLEHANMIAEGVDDFEDEILAEKLDKALFMTEISKINFDEKKVVLFLTKAREMLIEAFLKCTYEEEKEELLDIVFKAIAAEKESNLYKDENWNVIFDTLD